jgi:hypothetical protein
MPCTVCASALPSLQRRENCPDGLCAGFHLFLSPDDQRAVARDLQPLLPHIERVGDCCLPL